MPPAKFFSRVPTTWDLWQRAVEKSTQDHNPHDQQEWSSASKLRKEEYLVLRCLWTQYEIEDLPEMLRMFDLREYFNKANKWLRKFPPFQAYLQQVTAGLRTDKYDPDRPSVGPGPWGTGIFEIPAAEQGRILSALARQRADPRKKSKRMIDEDSVNLGLVAFLIAVASKHPSLRSRWTPHRRPIKAKFGNGAEMEAQVDGYFGGEEAPITVILEAKSGPRDYHEPQVSMQETAEVVALIMTQDVKPKR
jgi:hypothetical protein